MEAPDRRWLTAIGFTAGLLLLVAVAISDTLTFLGAFMLLLVAAALGVFYLLFPGSRFFALSLANNIAVYACIFTYFVEGSFPGITPWLGPVGFFFPILGFVLGAYLDREALVAVIADAHLRARGDFLASFRWLVPVAAIGLLSFTVPDLGFNRFEQNIAFLASMGAIGAVVFVATHSISVFLIEVGLLFQDFSERMETLAVPAFAFLTFYSLIVIVFASIYVIVDKAIPGAQFRIDGIERPIVFLESLYFSVITLSTVGYGDITPLAYSVRVVASIQILCGVLLLLFGFAEIRRYGVELAERRHKR